MQPRKSPVPRMAATIVALVAATALQASPAAAAPADSRQLAYESAAASYGVPVDVLLAVSYLESRWDANAGTPSTDAGFGPMHLTDAAYVATLPRFDGDQRGDDARPMAQLPAAPTGTSAGVQTLATASALTGIDA